MKGRSHQTAKPGVKSHATLFLTTISFPTKQLYLSGRFLAIFPFKIFPSYLLGHRSLANLHSVCLATRAVLQSVS